MVLKCSTYFASGISRFIFIEEQLLLRILHFVLVLVLQPKTNKTIHYLYELFTINTLSFLNYRFIFLCLRRRVHKVHEWDHKKQLFEHFCKMLVLFAKNYHTLVFFRCNHFCITASRVRSGLTSTTEPTDRPKFCIYMRGGSRAQFLPEGRVFRVLRS